MRERRLKLLGRDRNVSRIRVRLGRWNCHRERGADWGNGGVRYAGHGHRLDGLFDRRRHGRDAERDVERKRSLGRCERWYRHG
jgi:hypothetical protein